MVLSTDDLLNCRSEFQHCDIVLE